MKSELQRILKSDLSQYKIAVSEKINNLDHFQQCLTQRSAFMENFNLLLKEELERLKKQPPTQFDEIQISQLTRQPRFGPIQQQKNDYSQTLELLPRSVEIKYKKAQSPKITIHKPRKIDLVKFVQELKKNIFELKSEYETIRQKIVITLQTTKKGIRKELNNNMVDIIQIVNNVYENKINSLEAMVDNLKRQNQTLKTRYDTKQNERQSEFLKHRQQVQKKIEEQIQKNRAQFKNIELQQIDWKEMENKNLRNLNQNRKIHVKVGSHSDQQWNSMPTKQNRQRDFSPICAFDNSTNKRYEDQLEGPLLSSENPSNVLNESPYQTRYELQEYPKQMTINSKQCVWKHYFCGLEQATLKQLSQPKSLKTAMKSPMKVPEYLNIQYVCTQNGDSRYLQCQTQPNLPVLLRKANTQKTVYEIPAVKMLLIPNPPVQQGFSVLKLGNDIIYKGMWRFRKFHGRGKLNLAQYSYDGDFEYGLFHGRGSLKIDNLEYIGDFCENRAEGEGRLKIGCKDISGRWKNNVLIQKY